MELRFEDGSSGAFVSTDAPVFARSVHGDKQTRRRKRIARVAQCRKRRQGQPTTRCRHHAMRGAGLRAQRAIRRHRIVNGGGNGCSGASRYSMETNATRASARRAAKFRCVLAADAISASV